MSVYSEELYIASKGESDIIDITESVQKLINKSNTKMKKKLKDQKDK